VCDPDCYPPNSPSDSGDWDSLEPVCASGITYMNKAEAQYDGEGGQRGVGGKRRRVCVVGAGWEQDAVWPASLAVSGGGGGNGSRSRSGAGAACRASPVGLAGAMWKPRVDLLSIRNQSSQPTLVFCLPQATPTSA